MTELESAVLTRHDIIIAQITNTLDKLTNVVSDFKAMDEKIGHIDKELGEVNSQITNLRSRNDKHLLWIILLILSTVGASFTYTYESHHHLQELIERIYIK